jgi:hypothetical protein
MPAIAKFCLGTVAVRDADRIRMLGREKYVIPARARNEDRFSIRAGDVVRELSLSGVNQVCSALKTRKFLQDNNLRLVDSSGPPSGQSTTVIYTYEFVDSKKDRDSGADRQDAWNRLRGALKDVFDELGGGENYLRNERANFYGPGKE